MAQQLLGLPVAEALTERLVPRVEALRAQGVVPCLAIIRVGERADDLSYERGAEKRCARLGIELRKFVLDAQCTQAEIMDAIYQVNVDPTIHGCLLFRPLPSHLNHPLAYDAVDPRKDMDCITAGSVYGVYTGRPVGFAPCTAEAVIELLDYYGFELSGANVTVVGRSLVIGKPLSMLLQSRDATVTMCHTRTRDLPAACRNADILVVATGHIGTVGAGEVVPGQVVVDVGINWDEAAGKLCGDVLYDEVEPIVGAITPVPRGVGSITTAVLAKHVIQAAERSLEEAGDRSLEEA